jgi:membrane fusion protein, copper/silver efflux system
MLTIWWTAKVLLKRIINAAIGMKRKDFIKTLAFISLTPAIILSACKETGKNDAAGQKKLTYTCPMHPQVVQDKPGNCPVCGMDLVVFDKDNRELSLTLGNSQIALANITTMVVGTGSVSDSKQLNGRLVTDPEKTTIVSSRVSGRIETLYVRETGVKVNKGQPVYRIYSEQLNALQQEYLLSIAQVRQFPDDVRFRQIEKAARQKLVLYDQSDARIAALQQSGKADPYIVYTATAGGIVSAINVTEDQYVAEGGVVMQLESYDQLWVEADIYPAEASLIREGQSVKVIVPGWEITPRQMTVQFINPSLAAGTQLMQLRGTISNPDNRWQPGQQVNVLLPVKSKADVISLPVDAVIRNGKGTHVWVALGAGKYEPRLVRTGMENFESVEIMEGLEEGETVVVTGAYLLYAEYMLKKGVDPVDMLMAM